MWLENSSMFCLKVWEIVLCYRGHIYNHGCGQVELKKKKKRQRDHPGTLQKSTFKGVAEEITGQRNLRKFKKQREKKV